MKKWYLILTMIWAYQSCNGAGEKPTITNLPKRSSTLMYEQNEQEKKKAQFLYRNKLVTHKPEKYQPIVYDKKGKRYLATRTVSNNDTLNFPDDFSVSDEWVPLKDELPYHKACFLTAHNAHTNKANNWIYAQQKWSITKQLEHGVRCLMLDLHNGKNNTAVLAHGNTSCCYGFQKIGAYQKFSQVLSKILTFVKNNPYEIVTIMLENYLNPKAKVDDIIKSVPDLKQHVLTEFDWNPTYHNGDWPTIGWLREHNKRIIFFDNYYSSNFRYKLIMHMTENQWGTFNIEKATEESGRSKAYNNLLRTLYLLNYFASFTPPEYTHDTHNSYQQLKAVLLRAKEKGLANKRMPNFIALDFVNKGSALRLVNRLNDIATSKIIKFRKPRKQTTNLENTHSDKELLVNTKQQK